MAPEGTTRGQPLEHYREYLHLQVRLQLAARLRGGKQSEGRVPS